jgi:hypothetical protein
MVAIIAVVLMFLGIIVSVTGGMVELRWLKFTGVYMTLLGFIALVGGNLILQQVAETRRNWRIADARAKRRRSAPASGDPQTLERADTTNKLLPVGEDDFVPRSVVENTTELLKEPSRRK